MNIPKIIKHAIKSRTNPKPRFIEFDVTKRCNSHCKYCDIWKGKKPGKELTWEEIALAFAESSDYLSDVEYIVVTGGEPLLGWQRAYPELLKHPKMHGLKEITFETNGTQPLHSAFADYLDQWVWHDDRPHPGFEREITFSVSAKLSCSGENAEDAIKPDVVASYQNHGYVYLKFVIATEDDAKEALEAVEKYRDAGFFGPVYFMPVGGVESVYHINNRRVAELAMANGVRYSDRLQVPLFKNAWAT